MSDLAIRVEGLSKRYRIGTRERYRTLRDTLSDTIAAAFRRRSRDEPDSAEFWALKDVSFEVKHGEVVGTIGRNGAGKSTLLKILSRITEPTEGRVEMHGRVGSLLEVGTGFHPELTGRENIYLNGAILGMKRVEINRRFDEIVAFAEVEKFLDTPVKHYSSGMYVRLAFGVAAHLETEILLVDEVLAVGDAAFQKKCLRKMNDAAVSGRSVVLVSHQMNQIRKLSHRVVWLDSGGIRGDGAAGFVLTAYEASMSGMREGALRDPARKLTRTQFLDWRIVQDRDLPPNLVATSGPAVLEFTLYVDRPIRNGHHGIALFGNDNQLVWANALLNISLDPGVHALRCSIQDLPLRPGPYYWQVSMHSESGLLDLWDCSPEMVIDIPLASHPNEKWQGILNVPCEFSCETIKSTPEAEAQASMIAPPL